MDRHTARYIYEHRLLPHWFFDLKEKFAMSLITDPGLLYKMLLGTFEQNQVACPYQKEQFQVIPGRFTDTITVIKLVFPEPEEDPLCYAAFLFFDENFQNLSYITVEKGKKHMEIGSCELGGMKDFKRAAEYYMNRYFPS